MNRGLFYFLLFWHLTLMLAYNVSSTVRGYSQLEDTGSGYFRGIQRAAKAITSLSLTRNAARYAGTATGYGFFAPRVGSSFLLEVSMMGEGGIPYQTIVMPPIKQAHSMVRYHSLLNRMQHLLDDECESSGEPTLQKRQARAIAHCLAERIARLKWTKIASPIRCDVFVYGSTPLWRNGAATRTYRMLAYRHDIDRPVGP